MSESAQGSGSKIGCILGCVGAAIAVVGSAVVLVVGGAGAAFWYTMTGTEMPTPDEMPVAQEAVGDEAADGEASNEEAPDAEAAAGSTEPKAEVPAVVPSAGEAKPETVEAKPEAKTETKPETKAEAKVEAKPETKTETKTESKTEAKTETKSTTSAAPVTVQGKAKVVLIGSKRYTLPAVVPAGKYQIEATFDGQAPVQTGTVRVPEEGGIVIACNPNMGICRPR